MSTYGMGLEVNKQERASEFNQFVVVDPNEIKALAEIAVKKVMREVKEWDPDNIESYLRNIGRHLVEGIADLRKPFKFIIVLDGGPRMGAAMEVAHIQHWEPKKDGYIKHEWSCSYMFVWVTVYWTAV